MKITKDKIKFKEIINKLYKGIANLIHNVITNILYFLTCLIIPYFIVGITDIFPEDNKTSYFFLIIFILYIIALFKILPLVKVKREIKNLNIKIKDANQYNEIANIISESKSEIIRNLFNKYSKSLKYKEEVNFNGEKVRKYFSTIDIGNYFDEENLVYRNISEKTINHITQGLTGVGIFGTFLGIVSGVSGLDMTNSDTMKVGIEILLSGVKVSFNSSLYGILFSLILTFIYKIAIDKVMIKAHKFCDYVNSKIEIYSEESGFKELEEELKKQTSMNEKIATELAEEMGKRFDSSLNSNIALLAATIQPMMEKLDDAINAIQAKQEQSTTEFMRESINSVKQAINVGASSEIDKIKESMKLIYSRNEQMLSSFTSSIDNMSKIGNDISKFNEDFRSIKDSTIEMATKLNKNFTKMTNDLEVASSLLTDSVKCLNDDLVVKVNSMTSLLSNLTKDLEKNQKKTIELTNKIGSFAEVEKSSQELWTSYKGSFDSLNNNINEGVENYTKLIAEGVNSLFVQYDRKIAEAVTALKNVVEILNDSTEEITESLEPLEKISDLTKVLR